VPVRVAFAAALGLLAAGCGAGSKPLAVATLDTTTPSTTSGAAPSENPSATAFATCMTAHGVPTESPGGQGIVMSAAPSAQANAAMAACRALMPGGGPPPLTPAQQAKRTQQLYVFAKCMRSHDMPGFPDPDSTGEIPFDKIGALDSRHFYRAYTACRALYPHTGPQFRLSPAP
jgi:hypothetical protein